MKDNAKCFTVYMHIFPNEKVYVGMTSRKTYERWCGGTGYKYQPQVWRAIEKYGWKNIRHVVVKSGLSKAEAETLERELIRRYKANDIAHGYNIENGGTSLGKVSTITKQKLRETHSGEKNPFYGRHLSETHKEKIRNTRKSRDIQPANKRPIRCVETGVIYESTAQATRETGAHNSAIRNVCYGKRKTAGGYHWEYVDA